MTQSDPNRTSLTSGFLIALITQVGCLTLIIISATLGIGIWLDNVLGTKPILTLVFLLAGTPLSVIAMLFVARRAIAKIRSQPAGRGDDLAR